MAEKASGVMLLGSGPKPKTEERTSPKSSSLSAAKALLSALKADDAEAADEALRLHYEMCQTPEE
jgi:DNA-binding GntR family transcriptional regulator